MTETKLQKLAKNLAEEIPEPRTISDVYTHVRELIKRQREYFRDYMGAENILKLVFYIWCWKKERSFNSVNNYFSNLFFATLFSTDGENVEESCDTCGGDGRNDCSECDGSGSEECGECDGEGENVCPECDGTGSIKNSEGEDEECEECGGGGKIDCDNCDGRGSVDCSECDGASSIHCHDCQGDGNVETDKVYVKKTNIVTWDPTFARQLTNSFIDEEPFDYDMISDSTLILSETTDEEEIKNWVDEEVYYVVYESNNPKLGFDSIYLSIDLPPKGRQRYIHYIRYDTYII